MRKRIGMLEALERGRKNTETMMTWEEVMAHGLNCGMLYGEIGVALRFSYRLQREGNDQYLMQFARQIESTVRAKVGADRTALLAEIDKLRGEITLLHNTDVTGAAPNGKETKQ